jgi:Ni,Fe-hydrogenase III small subunit
VTRDRAPIPYGPRHFAGEPTQAATEPSSDEAQELIVPSAATPELIVPSTAGRRLAAEIRRRLARSLHIRHLDAGSCNGCDWEIAALLNPYHDLQRFGIDFVASPRHADLLLVTGIMSRNLEEAALRTYEAMPEPRLVVAVGACAISGGVFAGTYAGRDGIADVLPIDVLVPGCPPRPEALIHGLLLAVGRLGGGLDSVTAPPTP